jgi:sulfate permease family protein
VSAWAAPAPRGIRRYVPILTWLPAYDRRYLRFDIVAGATVWGLLVPEMIAYAGLAGLPPQAGLYTLLAAPAAYAVFGTSRHLSRPAPRPRRFWSPRPSPISARRAQGSMPLTRRR